MNSALTFIAIVSFSVVAATLWLIGQFLYPRRSDDTRGKTAADEKQDSIAAARQRLQAAQASAMSEAQQQDYQQEIQQQLLEEVRASESVANEAAADEIAPQKDYLAAAIICLSLLILPAALYAIVGTPSAWQPAPAVVISDGEAPSIDELVTRLETRLTDNPDDASTAYWLGRVAAAQGDLTKAQQSFARAYELDSKNPDIIAAYADSLMSAPAATDSTIDIAALIESGLAADENHAILLWLRGAHAESKGELETAIDYWQRAADALGDNPAQQQEILTIIADTKHQLALQGGEQP